MRALLLCVALAACLSGSLGARRRLLAGGPPRRPVQRRPFGWPRLGDGERRDFPRRPVPGRVPPQQLRLAPREPLPQAPPPQPLDQQFRGPFLPDPPQALREEPREPFAREPFRQESQEPFRQESQEPREPFRQESQEPREPFRQEFQEPQEAIRQEFQEPREPFRQEPQQAIGQEPEEPFTQELEELSRQNSEEPFRPESLEPFRQESQQQSAENEKPEERSPPVKKAQALEERKALAADTVAQKRQDFVPLAPLAEQRRAPSYDETELTADDRQDQYSLNIPEKKEKQRLEFQVHGQQGPHSYRFGYDTGSGYNRQFRFEERDADGNLKGRYGYYKDGKLQVVNYSATHKGGFHAEGDFGKFPENKY